MEYVGRDEYAEFVKRIENETKMQSKQSENSINAQTKRIDKLEQSVDTYGKLVISVNEIACTMKGMLEEQKSQVIRLSKLEERDGESWRKFTWFVITTIVGIIIGYII